MIKGFYTAKASLIQRQKQTNVISNNIANVNTKNFKRDNSEFGQILSNQIEENYPDLNKADYLIGGGSKIDRVNIDFAQGDTVSTEKNLDLALNGDGFFTLVDNDNNQYYTRGGSFNFTTTQSRTKNIVNGKGYSLANNNGEKIEVPFDVSEINIKDDGKIEYENQNRNEDIGIVDINDKENLERVNSGVYQGEVEEIDSKANVMQGFLEMSNTDLAKELVSLITNQRIFSMNSKVIQTVDEMSSLANNLKK